MAADPSIASLIFRPMETADLEQVVQNETRSYAFPWTSGIFTDCLAANYECWLAVREIEGRPKSDDVIGHGIMSVAANEAHLLNVCVRRDEQGLGYGRGLVEHMIDTARQRAANTIFLEVRLSNYIAARLYHTLGFNEIGQRQNYYPSHLGNEDARVLALDLSLEWDPATGPS